SEALRAAASDHELGQWFAEEQAFDRAIAAQLEAVPAPFGLKTRILDSAVPPAEARGWSWAVKLAGIAALLFLAVQIVSFFRPAAPVTAAVSDYAGEMVSFIALDPPLEVDSSDLGEIKGYLAKKEMPAMDVPARLAGLQPLGCRVLSFRGHNVALICFRRGGDRLAHLFVVDQAAMPRMRAGEGPVYADARGWSTATWVENGRVYTIAVQGDRAAVQRYLPSA
ncbi:MAG: hypothetical protein WBV37_12115, partial [Nocardioidaceae bacterium]